MLERGCLEAGSLGGEALNPSVVAIVLGQVSWVLQCVPREAEESLLQHLRTGEERELGGELPNPFAVASVSDQTLGRS